MSLHKTYPQISKKSPIFAPPPRKSPGIAPPSEEYLHREQIQICKWNLGVMHLFPTHLPSRVLFFFALDKVTTARHPIEGKYVAATLPPHNPYHRFIVTVVLTIICRRLCSHAFFFSVFFLINCWSSVVASVVLPQLGAILHCCGFNNLLVAFFLPFQTNKKTINSS